MLCCFLVVAAALNVHAADGDLCCRRLEAEVSSQRKEIDSLKELTVALVREMKRELSDDVKQRAAQRETPHA